MRVILLLVLLLTVTGSAQVVPDCSVCTDAQWGREWHPQHESCTSNPIAGCGYGCNCFMGFLNLPPDEETKSVGASGFFGGAFTKDGGFRVDRPGPLARARIQAGDVIYLLNGRKPSKAALARFTEKQPARRMLVTYNSAGKLSLRLYRE
jgi:hypothetical protein